MRKIYLLRQNEEDGRVLEALPDPRMDPEEIPNPTCPRCGSGTLMAYEEGDDYEVLTWFCLTDEDEEAKPDAWYLICQDLECPYEEQVERVYDPVGAELFDLEQSHTEFDEDVGLIARHPADMKLLIRWLEAAIKRYAYRKLEVFLEEARWRYNDGMKQIRKWISKIPPGRQIKFWMDGDYRKAIFLMATDDALLVEMLPEREMMAVKAESLQSYGPRTFEENEPEETDFSKIDPDSWITLFPSQEWVVVQGHHIRLWHVNRFGQYWVTTSDAEIAAALGLQPRGENSWEGNLLRHQIEARYEKQRLVKVKGYWLEVHGETGQSRSPSVYTEDPAAAAALGLEKVKPWFPEEYYDPYQLSLPRFSGVIPREQVEEWDEVVVYQWPIPEAKGSESI